MKDDSEMPFITIPSKRKNDSRDKGKLIKRAKQMKTNESQEK